ncbi:MAG: NAD(P)H-dependent oxidoreductase subunit E [Actinomycetota bacterium]
MNRCSNGARKRVLSDDLRRKAEEIVSKYPNPRSATLPLLFLVQSVEGYITEDGMREVADILGLTPAQVLAASSFYTMLKKEPQGEFLVSVCRNISCTHRGARGVVAAVSERLGIEPGGTTPDGKFTLETAECLATCDGAPSAQVNYEDFYDLTTESAVQLIDRIEQGDEVRSVRGEPIRSSREIAYDTAIAGLRVPGTAGDQTARTIGGESPRADTAPGFRPKVTGEGAGGSGGSRTGATNPREQASEDGEDGRG